MGKKDKNKKQGKGAVKTNQKTDKKLLAKQKKRLEKLGEKDVIEVVKELEAVEQQRQSVTETIVPPPTPRTNFSICAYPEKDEIILFGGEFFNGQNLVIYNELYIYNILKNEWKLIKSPAGPAPRSSHQMVYVGTDGGQLWLFGGEYASKSQLQFYHYKDLWMYHLQNKKWNKIKVDGSAPSPRSGHRMVLMKKKLFVFGGFYDNGISYKYLNDVWIFSLDTYKWHEVKITGASQPPAPRSACCMTATSDERILIWGGYSRTAVKKEIDRGITHTDMFALIQDKTDTKGLTWKWMSIKSSGMRPIPRNGVNLAVVQDNSKAYVFGGCLDVDEDEENLQGNFSSDMNMLNLTSHKWNLIELSGKKPPSVKSTNTHIQMRNDDECAKASSTIMSNDGIFTMSVGDSSKSSVSSTSKQIPLQNSAVCIPSPRMKAGLTISKGILYLYGGVYEDGDKQLTLSDFYSINLHKLDTWKTIIENTSNNHEWIASDSESSDKESTNSNDNSSDSSEDDESDDSEMDTD